MKSVLLACASPETGAVVIDTLKRTCRIDTAEDRVSCLARFRAKRYDFTIIDLQILSGGRRGETSYEDLLEAFWAVFPRAEIIILAPQAQIREAVRAVKAGASDYLTYPVTPSELRHVITSIQRHGRLLSELDYLRASSRDHGALEDIESRSPGMQEALRKIRLVAPTRSTVLFTGETGTGKGVAARLLHQHSNRRNAQFVAVHCGAIPETLIESELFGYEKGAFTGANQRRPGKFELANGGTIFLDEIGTIGPSTQIKLLQVLQERTVQRLGADMPVDVDVRVIAATNCDLEEMCSREQFRRDLYYRLNVFPIHIPALRERTEDLPLLADVMLAKLNRNHPTRVRRVHPSVMRALQNYTWPGNVRELENLLERALILENASTLTLDSFPPEVTSGARPGHTPQVGVPDTSLGLEEARARAVAEFERRYLRVLLSVHGGRIARTAEAAGITTRHLHNLMQRHGLRKEDFKQKTGPKPEVPDPNSGRDSEL